MECLQTGSIFRGYKPKRRRAQAENLRGKSEFSSNVNKGSDGLGEEFNGNSYWRFKGFTFNILVNACKFYMS